MAEWHDGVSSRTTAPVVISDVYKAMQARLDGYRHGAGAMMIGVIAAVLAVDSALIRSILDESFMKALDARADYYFNFVIGGAGLLVVGICIGGHIVISQIEKYFAEMTAVVYKIDQANKMWDVDYWFKNASFYPNIFKTGKNVSRNTKVDPELIGWFDPTIRGYKLFIKVLIGLHVLFFGALLTYGWL